MKFNKYGAVGFLIGFYIIPEFIYSLILFNPYLLARNMVAIGLSIAFGFLFGRKK